MSFTEFTERVEAECYNSPTLIGAFGFICIIFAVLIVISKLLATMVCVAMAGSCIYFAKEQRDQESSKGRTVDSDSTDEGSSPSS